MSARRVAVFIDYENMSRCASSSFGGSGHFWPWKLGERLVEIRNASGANPESVLHQVRVYRGLPDARRQRGANAANQAQTAAWVKACPDVDHLRVFRRPLRYPKKWPNGSERPQEKGVDVALAVDLVQISYQGGFDVGIVCSHDSDLAPALDVAASVRTTGVHLEVASWAKQKRISFSDNSNKPWCHRLSGADFAQVQDQTNYVPNGTT
ncbi:MAG: NYN domain-containing protein [Desertimonas sp.]